MLEQRSTFLPAAVWHACHWHSADAAHCVLQAEGSAAVSHALQASLEPPSALLLHTLQSHMLPALCVSPLTGTLSLFENRSLMHGNSALNRAEICR